MTGCLIIYALIIRAQPSDILIVFSGYLLDEDSIPIENAFLVNYRTIRCYSTNEKGYFKIWLLKGDSLMINHLSFERKVIKANNSNPNLNCYLLKFSPFEMKTVAIKYRDFEMENFRRNMKQINNEIRKHTPNYQVETDRNKYAPPSAATQFVGLNLFEIIRYVKNKKYNKKWKMFIDTS